MGCCCEAHLQTKINEYMENAKDGTVSVSKAYSGLKCDYCQARAAYVVSYISK